MTTTHPALAYAEGTLGVHEIYEEALALNSELDQLLGAKDKALDEKRTIDDQVTDREMDLMIDERGKHPDHSQAAFDRHIKEVYHNDEDLKRLRLLKNAKAAEVSGVDLDIEYNKARRSVLTARMYELGGYFQYLAASKLGEIERSRIMYSHQPTQPTQPTQQTQPTTPTQPVQPTQPEGSQ